MVRQRERLAAERHRLPEGGAELAGIAGVQIRRQIDQGAGAGIATDLLVLDPEDVGGLSPREAGVDQLIELHRIAVDLQPDRHIRMQGLIFVDDRPERVFLSLGTPYRQGQGDRRLRPGTPVQSGTGDRRGGDPNCEQPASSDAGAAVSAINGHVSPTNSRYLANSMMLLGSLQKPAAGAPFAEPPPMLWWACNKR